MSAERLYLERVSGIPLEVDDRQLGELAILYANVFAGKPWNEYTTCPGSGTFFGKDTQPGENCPELTCEAVLKPAYPKEETMTHIASELARPNAVLWLLRDTSEQDKTVGFSWGFSYTSPETFAEDKYRTPEMRTAISGLLRRLGLGANGLWYLSESGIEDNTRYRGRGWSRAFHEERLKVARTLGLDAVQRTSSKGNMYRTSMRTMEQIAGPVMQLDNMRQLQPTGRAANGFVDNENPARVLFASHQYEL